MEVGNGAVGVFWRGCLRGGEGQDGDHPGENCDGVVLAVAVAEGVHLTLETLECIQRLTTYHSSHSTAPIERHSRQCSLPLLSALQPPIFQQKLPAPTRGQAPLSIHTRSLPMDPGGRQTGLWVSPAVFQKRLQMRPCQDTLAGNNKTQAAIHVCPRWLPPRSNCSLWRRSNRCWALIAIGRCILHIFDIHDASLR